MFGYLFRELRVNLVGLMLLSKPSTTEGAPPGATRWNKSARHSCENDASSAAPWPTGLRMQATASLHSPCSIRRNGSRRGRPTQSSVSTGSSTVGSKHRQCCRVRKPYRCCSGRYSLPGKSICANSMVGRPSTNRASPCPLTSPPDQAASQTAQRMPLENFHHFRDTALGGWKRSVMISECGIQQDSVRG